MGGDSSRQRGKGRGDAEHYRAPKSVPWGVPEGVALLAAFHLLAPLLAAALTMRCPEHQRDMLATLLSDVAMLVIVALLVARWAGGRRKGFAALGLRSTSLRDVLGAWRILVVGAVAYIAVAMASVQVAEALEMEWQIQRVARVVQAARTPAELALAVVAAVVVAPLAEEIVFRSAFYLPLRALLGPVSAALIVSVVFSAAHVYPWGAVNLVVLSLIFIALFERTGSLWAPIAAHVLYNAANFALIRFVLPPG